MKAKVSIFIYVSKGIASLFSLIVFVSSLNYPSFDDGLCYGYALFGVKHLDLIE